MLNTQRPEEFLECAGGERWAAVSVCLEQLSADGHEFGCSGVIWL